MESKIIQGDCLNELPKIEDKSVDAVISDIPYGIGYEDWDILHSNTNSALGGQSKSQRTRGDLYKRRGKPLNGWSEADKSISIEYQNWCSLWASECLRVLKPGGSCIIFAGRRYAHRCIIALEDAGFTFKDMLSWEKPKAPLRAQRLSAIYERRNDSLNAKKWQGWRVANPRPLFEPILWFQKPYKLGGTIADNVLDYSVGAWNTQAFSNCSTEEKGGFSQSNIIKCAVAKTDSGLHPTQKPIALMRFLIELVTVDDATVLDPFCGSGTTCLAAKELNRSYIGIERDADMIAIAKRRVGGMSGSSGLPQQNDS